MARGPVGSMPAQRAKNFKGTLKRLLSELKQYKLKVGLVILLVVASVLLSIFAPKVLMQATNYLQTPFNIDFGHAGRILLIVGVMYLLAMAFQSLGAIIIASISQKVVLNLRNKLRHKLTLLPLKYFDNRQVGEVQSSFTNDCDNISNGLQQSITQMLSAILTVIGVVAMMLSINVWLTLIMLATVPLTGLLTSKVFKSSQKKFQQQQEMLSHLNGHIEETYQSHKMVKANNQEETETEKFDAINEKLTEANQKSQFLSGLVFPIINFVSNFSYVTLAVVSCIFIANDSLQFGALTAVLQYSQQFNQPIGQVAQIASVLQNTVAGAERVYEILDEAEEVQDAENAISEFDIHGDIAFQNVNFGYQMDKPLFQDVSLTALQGQVIAIVGKTGAGKTTIVNLLMRFYEISDGEILLDDTNINQFTKNFLRRNIGMVLQDTWLFHGSIKDNIAFGKPEATMEEIAEAAKQAQCHHFIETLPQGYETIINEQASNISNGQKQLITIARALLVSPKILILDEATSSVDTRTELLIQKAMKNLMKGRTSFVIAHRLSTITSASKILVMDNGTIVEEGTHKELLKNTNGYYHSLWHSSLALSEQE